MILADTSIWIDFFRSGNPALTSLLRNNQVVIHPFIVGELSLGSLRDRQRTLAMLDNLPAVPVANLNDVRRMIETRRLYAKGIGLTDAHLLASCLLSPPALLWTADTRLNSIAEILGVRANLP
jgi:predicted nucleic acid-binding protein